MNPCVLLEEGGWDQKNTSRCQEQQVRVSAAKTIGRQYDNVPIIAILMSVLFASNAIKPTSSVQRGYLRKLTFRFLLLLYRRIPEFTRAISGETCLIPRAFGVTVPTLSFV